MRKKIAEKLAANRNAKRKRIISPETRERLRQQALRLAEKRREEKRAEERATQKRYGVEREPWKKETRGGKKKRKKKYKRKPYIAKRPKAVGYVVLDGSNRPLENILDPYGDTPRMKILLDGGSQATLFKTREMAQRAIKVTARYAQADLPEMGAKLDDLWKTNEYQVVRIVQ